MLTSFNQPGMFLKAMNRGFAAILILIPIAIVALLITVTIFKPTGESKLPTFKTDHGSQKDTNDTHNYFDDVSDLPSCGDKKEFFTTLPLSLDSFTTIDPLGLLSPTAHVFPAPHLYFRIKGAGGSFEAAVLKFPLYAPADSTVTEIALIHAINKPELVDDAAVYFSPCSQFKAYFDHVVDLSPNLKDAFDKAPIDQCNEYTLTYRSGPVNWKHCRKRVSVKVSEGELIGYAGGGQAQAALDFGAYDARIAPNNYANPKRSFMPQLAYNVCPLDYFSEELERKLRDRLGGVSPTSFYSNTPIKSPTCGKVIQDVDGTAKGYWFTPATRSDYEPSHLALVQGHIDQSQQAFSNGDSTKKSNLEMGLYFFEPRNSGFANRDFSEVKADGNIYCYETNNIYQNGGLKTIIIQLTDPKRLKIEGLDIKSCGPGPWQMTNPTEFER